MDDYSYVVNDSQITYTTIGKFCSIAAMTRINPGNHPMQRAIAGAFHLSRQRLFPGRRATTPNSSHWRRAHHVHIGHDVWIGHGADRAAGPQHRHRRGDRGRRHRHQGRAGLHDRRRQSGARRSGDGFRRTSPTVWRIWHGGTGTTRRCAARCPISASCRSRSFSTNTKPPRTAVTRRNGSDDHDRPSDRRRPDAARRRDRRDLAADCRAGRSIARRHGRTAMPRFGIDAGGLLVLPGIVDLHGDAFERQMMPRPGVDFPDRCGAGRQRPAGDRQRHHHGVSRHDLVVGAGPAQRRQCAAAARGHRR